MMNDKTFMNNVKLIELARFFINEYKYQEINLRNIEGIILENKDLKFPLIRISLKENSSIVDYNKELAVLKRLIDEYQGITSLEDVKILSIYFGGVVEDKIDNIYSIVLNNNNDILNNSIIQDEFPDLIQKFDFDKYNKDSINNELTLFDNDANKSQNSSPLFTNEKNILEMFNIKEFNKKIRFTRIFTVAFVLINILFLYLTFNKADYSLDLSYYSIFIENLNQYYRAFSGLFLADGLLQIFIFGYFFYRYNSYVEMKLGSKKTLILYVISLIAIYIAMFSIAKGSVLFGPYPIIAISAGAFLSTLLLPSEIKTIKLQSSNIFYMILLFIAIGLMSIVNYNIIIIAFSFGFFLTIALNIKEKEVNKKLVALMSAIAILIFSFNFIPSQTLARNYNFEKEYFKYQDYYHPEKAIVEKEKIDKYYKEIGAVDYE